MFDLAECSPTYLPWDVNSPGDHELACQRCEIESEVTHHALTEMVLKSDRRKQGVHRRRVVVAIPESNLRVNDRLEPSSATPDVFTFEENAPTTAIFWRVSAETLARHRNPIWCLETGLDPSLHLCVDSLHTLYLGPMKQYCEVAVWVVFDSGILGVGVQSTDDEILEMSVVLLRVKLMHW